MAYFVKSHIEGLSLGVIHGSNRVYIVVLYVCMVLGYIYVYVRTTEGSYSTVRTVTGVERDGHYFL